MATTLKQSTPLHEHRDEFYQKIRHFARLTVRVRWYLLGAGIALGIASGISLQRIASRQPALPATALIAVEKTTEMTAIKDVSGLMQAQSDLIASRIFLRDIAVQLSLQLRPLGFDRAALFDSISIDQSCRPGTYSFKLSDLDRKRGAAYAVSFIPDLKSSFSFSSLWRKLQPELMTDDETAKLSTLDLKGIHLVFTPAFIKAPHNFQFRVRDLRSTVEALLKKLDVKEEESRAGAGSGISNITVSVSDQDYALAAHIANRIADAFVERNLLFKRQRTENVLASLDKQLETAREDLALAENAWRGFKTANPTVGLSSGAQQHLDRVLAIEKGNSETAAMVRQAKVLEGRYLSASPENRENLAAEIAAFLAPKDPGATSFAGELSQLTAEEHDLARNYVHEHPLRIEAEQKVTNLEKEIFAALENFIGSSQKLQMDRTSEGMTLSTELQNLPNKELRLAQLDRRQQLAADIYSTVLSRLNQLKATNAGDVPEAFVMDYAVPPIPPPVNIVRILALLIFADLVILLFPVIAWDRISRTVHSEYEFLQKTGKPLLESIPCSSRLRKRRSSRDFVGDSSILKMTEKDKDEILPEIFRSLRTKVLVRMNESPGRAVVVTSLEPNSGKSTIAANLAGAIAQQNIRTLLIDADLRFGELNALFATQQKPGLSEFLDTKSDNPFDPSVSLIRTTSIPNLYFISSGEPKMHSSELLASGKFARLRKELAVHFPVIILDAPPLGPIVDAAIFDPALSFYLMIVRAGVTNVTDLSKRISEFPGVHQNVLGYVLNFATMDGKLKYYRYGRYYSRKVTEAAKK